MSLVLYYSPGACSMAPHIVLQETGAQYERRLVSISDGRTQSAKYLRVNSRGRVPALEVDGKVLVETCAILLYLARRFPQACLLPRDPMHEASCFSILAWLTACRARGSAGGGEPAAEGSVVRDQPLMRGVA